MIDARGLSCPQPVLLIKSAVEKTHESQYTLLTDKMFVVLPRVPDTKPSIRNKMRKSS